MSLTKVSYSMITGSPVNALDFGVTTASANNSAEFQAAIDYCIANNRALYIPGGEYKITASLNLNGGIRIYGDRMSGTYILVYGGVDCFVAPAAANFIHISDLSIGQNVRYTTTPNTASAILLNGTTAQQCYWHTYENLFIDGFYTAISAGGLCSSTITNITSTFCANGIDFFNQCLNNVIIGSHLGGPGNVVGSFGVRVGDALINCEGCIIADSLIFGFSRGVWINASIDVFIHHNIIDSAYDFGVVANAGAAAPCINNIIESNYIAMVSSGRAATGIYYVNNYAAADSQNNGTVIANNEILAYAGATMDNGILIEGTGDTRTSILGNRITASTFYDCYVKTGTGHRVANNLWRSTGFRSLVNVAYSNNIGTLVSDSIFSGVPQANTNAGNTPVATATTTTLFSLPNKEGLYQIVAYFSGTTFPSDYSASMLLFYNGSSGSPSSAIHSQHNGGAMTLTVSGGKDIQVNQTSGATINVYWSYIQIGATN